MQEFLRDRSKVQELVQLFDPLVRAVDRIAGERVSMRVRYTNMTKKVTKAYNLFLVYSVLKGVGGNLFILLQCIKQFRFLIILHNFSLFCFSGVWRTGWFGVFRWAQCSWYIQSQETLCVRFCFPEIYCGQGNPAESFSDVTFNLLMPLCYTSLM